MISRRVIVILMHNKFQNILSKTFEKFSTKKFNRKRGITFISPTNLMGRSEVNGPLIFEQYVLKLGILST